MFSFHNWQNNEAESLIISELSLLMLFYRTDWEKVREPLTSSTIDRRWEGSTPFNPALKDRLNRIDLWWSKVITVILFGEIDAKSANLTSNNILKIFDKESKDTFRYGSYEVQSVPKCSRRNLLRYVFVHEKKRPNRIVKKLKEAL